MSEGSEDARIAHLSSELQKDAAELRYEGRCATTEIDENAGNWYFGAARRIEEAIAQMAALTQALEEARQQPQVARAEVNVLRGVHCCADGDGPCGVCLKCARAEVSRLREALHELIQDWELVAEHFDLLAKAPKASPLSRDAAAAKVRAIRLVLPSFKQLTANPLAAPARPEEGQ